MLGTAWMPRDATSLLAGNIHLIFPNSRVWHGCPILHLKENTVTMWAYRTHSLCSCMLVTSPPGTLPPCCEGPGNSRNLHRRELRGSGGQPCSELPAMGQHIPGPGSKPQDMAAHWASRWPRMIPEAPRGKQPINPQPWKIINGHYLQP